MSYIRYTIKTHNYCDCGTVVCTLSTCNDLCTPISFLSRVVIYVALYRRFPDKTFPGQSLSWTRRFPERRFPYKTFPVQTLLGRQTFPGQVIPRNFHVHSVCKYQLYRPSYTICRYTERLLMCVCRPAVSIRGLFGKACSPTMGKV